MNLEKIQVITLTSQAFARLTARYFGDPTNLFKVWRKKKQNKTLFKYPGDKWEIFRKKVKVLFSTDTLHISNQVIFQEVTGVFNFFHTLP